MSSQAKKQKSSDQKIKNSMMDEDSPKKDETTKVLRRSLRHSPGNSSLSPPRKSRRLKEPLITPDKPIKETSLPVKSPKVNKTSPRSSQTPEKGLSLRSSKNIILENRESPSRITRNNPQVPINSQKAKCTPEKRSNGPVSTSKRTTRKNLNSSPDECHENHDSETKTTPKSKKKSNSGANQTHNDIPARSTRKRNLPLSPESPKRTANGASVELTKSSAKRICQNALSSNSTPNGKGAAYSERELDAIQDHCHLNLENSCINRASLFGSPQQGTKSMEDNRSPSKTNKRRLVQKDLAEEESIINSPKKCKLNNEVSSALSTLDNSNNLNSKCESHINTSNNCGNSMKSALNKEEVASSDSIMEVSNNVEHCLGTFGLSEVQKEEISSLLSEEIKDKNCINIIEELVHKLLQDDLNLPSMSSPRFNKLLRQLIMRYCSLEESTDKKHKLSETALSWAKERKVVNLQHELELALMTLYYDTGFYRKAEETANALYKETKKLQDKEKTVKACLCLSKAYHAMGNIAKARANITTAKTEALKIYTPPELQAELDLQSGIMQVAEEKDMETAFSYFKEAATAFTARKQRSRALKYMLLAKLLVNKPEEGQKAVTSQLHMGDIDEGVEALLHITKDAISCSLSSFMKTYETYKKELKEDFVIKKVIDDLYTKMLEKNLLNIISPYDRMQISFIADKIGLDRPEVERRLSQMILDGQISAQLDHRDDCLYVYQPESRDSVYPNALDTISQFDRTLSLLNRKIKKLL